MASQFTPMPPLGAAPYAPRPNSPRGLYRQFGAPESLLRIHFPDDPNKNKSKSAPWYWYVRRQQPTYFIFLGGVWGPGWLRRPAFPVIKILAIDSQQVIPTPFVGYTSVEDAIKKRAGSDVFGRFDPREQKFWDLIVRDDTKSKNQNFPYRERPPFNVVKGLIQARDSKTDINKIIRQAVQQFYGNFNTLADGYNQIASGVSPTGGFQYRGQISPFNIPLPEGPPTTLSRFQLQLDSFVQGPPYLQSSAYLGPISGTAFFNINTFTTQAHAFTIGIGQLDPKKWNMSVFPPKDATIIGNGLGSFYSEDYGGYSTSPFPLHGIELL